MSTDLLTTYLASAVASGGAIPFDYPAGSNSSNYDPASARLAIGDNTVVGVGANMSIAMGATGATVTLTGITANAFQTARLSLRRMDLPTSVGVVTGRALVEDVTANYTCLLADSGKTKRLTGGSGILINLPGTLPVGWTMGFIQTGAGVGTFTPQGSAALVGTNTKTGGADTSCSIIVELNTTGSAARYLLGGSVAA